MTNLETLLTELETARKNATQGEWQHIPGDSYCAFPVVTNKNRQICFEDHLGHELSPTSRCCDDGRSPDEFDPAFIVSSANNILKLIEIIRVQKLALDSFIETETAISNEGSVLLDECLECNAKVEALAKGEK